jgi:prepilin-type N-terminal cleavage/methylation domain-containing protein
MKKQQHGFTIIELMISMTIFSLVLMLCLAGIMHITKMYYRGVTQSRVQEKARSVVDEIAESIRYTPAGSSVVLQSSGGPDPIVNGPEVAPTAPDDTNYLCVGSKRYTYAIDRQLKSSPSADTQLKQKKHVLWVDDINGMCNSTVANFGTNTDPLSGQELLSENMRLTIFEVVPGSDVGTFTIRVGVAYGDNDLLEINPVDNSYKSCKNAVAGSEYCATSNVSLTVEKRL